MHDDNSKNADGNAQDPHEDVDNPPEAFRKAWQFITQPNHSNAVVAIFTILIFLSNIAYTTFAVLQWIETRKAADAAKSSAETAAGSLREMKQSGKISEEHTGTIIGHLNRVAGAMEGSVRQGRKAMEASNIQSKSALDASIEISRNEQQAWVGIGNISFSPIQIKKIDPFAESEPLEEIKADISIRNSGRTPALDVVIVTRTGINPPTDIDMPEDVPVTHDVIAPNSGYIIEAKSKPLIQFITRGIVGGWDHFYISGTIQYKDVFQRPHKTTFCRVTMKQTGGIMEQQVCHLPPKFNSMQ